jgi:hypothetical protein
MSEYPYDSCPNCGSDLDEDELYVFCLNEECGWSEEVPEEPRLVDSVESDFDEESILDTDEEEGE